MNTTPRIAAVLAVLMLISTSAHAALLSRAGGQAYYDTVLDITWLADANYAQTSGYDGDGYMTWSAAQTWIGTLNTANYLGVNTWRLPEVNPLNGSTFNYSLSYNGSTDYGHNQSEQGTAYAGATGSEMAYLFYNTLNNKGYCDPDLSTAGSCSGPQAGWGLTNTGPFSNLQPYVYWSGTTYAPETSSAWRFGFGNSFQGISSKSGSNYAWAVSSGDIAAVPVPGAVWLFGSAVAVLGALRRRGLNRTAA
jgi:hypothetical protein